MRQRILIDYDPEMELARTASRLGNTVIPWGLTQHGRDIVIFGVGDLILDSQGFQIFWLWYMLRTTRYQQAANSNSHLVNQTHMLNPQLFAGQVTTDGDVPKVLKTAYIHMVRSLGEWTQEEKHRMFHEVVGESF